MEGEQQALLDNDGNVIEGEQGAYDALGQELGPLREEKTRLEG